MGLITLIIMVPVGIVGTVIFFLRYRTEGLVGLYVCGVPILLLVTGLMGYRIPTIGTGIFSFLCAGIPCLLYLGGVGASDAGALQRRFSFGLLGLFVLFALWFIHHVIQRSTFIILDRGEYYKWAYGITYWFLPLLLGYVFPLSAERVQRMLRATVMVGIAMSAILILSYLTGRADVSGSYGARYSPVAKLGGLNYATTASFAFGALLGGYVVCQGRLKPRRILFLIIAGATLVACTILGGTRSSLLATGLAILVCLSTFRFRYLPIGLVVAGVAGVIVMFIVIPAMPEATIARVMTYESFVKGTNVRIYLFKESFNILKIAPAFGTTMYMQEVTGSSYSHNFMIQILVETGLVGVAIFIPIAISVIIRWAIMLKNKKSPLFSIGAPLLLLLVPVFIEYSVHGGITSQQIWLLLGMMAGHAIRRSVSVPSESQLLSFAHTGGWVKPGLTRAI